MAQLKWKLSALWAMLEVTFGTDPDTDGSDYKFLKSAFDMAFVPMVDIIEQSGLTNSLTRQKHVLGAKAGTLTFKLDVKGSGTPATDEVSSVAPEASDILEALFGSKTVGVGSAITGDRKSVV